MGFEDRPDYRYLKRIFKDLFDRQGFVDDGLYDWDILKKQQEQGVPIPGSVQAAALAAATTAGVGLDDGDEKLHEDGLRGAVSSSPITAGGLRKEEPQKEEGGDIKDSSLNQRRSIISSIRHSLFGSRNSSQRPDTSATGAASATGSKSR